MDKPDRVAEMSGGGLGRHQAVDDFLGDSFDNLLTSAEWKVIHGYTIAAVDMPPRNPYRSTSTVGTLPAPCDRRQLPH